MSDNNNLPQKKDSAEVALQKTTSLLSITNKILANRANRMLVVSDDAWLDELIAWADEHEIPDYYFDEYCCGEPVGWGEVRTPTNSTTRYQFDNTILIICVDALGCACKFEQKQATVCKCWGSYLTPTYGLHF